MYLTHAHFANLGKPGTYAEEVKKDQRGVNLHEAEVPNLDSAPIFKVPMPNNLVTKTMPANTTRRKRQLLSLLNSLRVTLKNYLTLSLLRARQASYLPFEPLTQPVPNWRQNSKIQRETFKSRPPQRYCMGGIPADPTDSGLKLFDKDPKTYATLGKH